MHFYIIFSIIMICASSQINAKSIDDKDLPQMLGDSAEVKYELAKLLQAKINAGTVTTKDIEMIRSMWKLSALVKNNVIHEVEKRLEALDTTTQPTITPSPTSTAPICTTSTSTSSTTTAPICTTSTSTRSTLATSTSTRSTLATSTSTRSTLTNPTSTTPTPTPTGLDSLNTADTIIRIRSS